MSSRQLISSGSPWEPKIGYSRAVVVGSHLSLSGTTATGADGNVIGVGDPYAQTKAILDKVGEVLQEAGFALTDVVRTRMFMTDISRWEDVAKAHGEVFSDIRPATTMVEVSKLIDPDHLIEIEVDAIKAE